ncbi:MAG: SpoIID/LytB domain-containing protein [Proteobacteria bacterium]|nr:SpoIID/LytB domain-containing protein [Pseudomonadota bacterium]
MAEPSRKLKRRSDPVIRGPVVILPPTTPGGPPRRFAIQPGRVIGLLALMFLLGAGVTGGLFAWHLTGLSQDYAHLDDEVQQLKHELTELREASTAVSSASEPTAMADPEAGAPTGDRLDLPISSLRGEEPRVRVAVLNTTEEVLLTGEGLVLVHEVGEPTPMPRGRVRIKPHGGGIHIEGVGGVRPGTLIESRLGPISLGDRSYPGRLEVQKDGKHIILVNVVGMEEYVAGVVSSELPASWGLEAKKAQAIAARSYAVMQMATAEGGWHLEATVMDQAYSGKPVDAGSRAAVTATHGKVLSAGGGLVSVYYSSTCAGRTEEPETVWPDRPSNGTGAADCGFCKKAPSFHWNATVTTAKLLEVLKAQGHRARAVETLQLRRSTRSGRVTSVDVVTDKGTVTWSGNDFRLLLGSTQIKSTRFELRFDEANSQFALTGTGFGHGVGLCQYGAQGMDQAGHDHTQILGRYFPAATIEELW